MNDPTDGSSDSEHPTPAVEGESQAGFVALVGAPNVGKSTLLNRILGRTLSITAPKPQTTRNRVLAVENRGARQFVFLDTPGIHTAKGLIHDRMVGQARTSAREADLTCWIVDAERGMGRTDREEIGQLADRPVVLALNKVDRIDPTKMLPIIGELAELLPDAACIPISALKGEGVEQLMETLGDLLPKGPWLYDDDTLTDRNERFFVAELVREQLFRQLRQELPYRVAVMVETFEKRGKKTFVSALVYTDSDSSKSMIIGKRGARIKQVGAIARTRIEEFLAEDVYLELLVKVKPGWQDDGRFLEELGI